VELPEPSTTGSNEFEPLSAAKCRAFKRTNHKVIYLGTFAAFVLLSFPPLLWIFHQDSLFFIQAKFIFRSYLTDIFSCLAVV
jgi:hypothetical protein